MREDDPAAGKGHRGWDVEALGEHSELVGLTVAVGVLTNLDAVVALAAVLELVRVIDSLDHPEASALVPRHVDRVDDIRLGGEQLHAEADRHLRVLHAVLGRERELVLERLGAALVVRDVAALLVLERRPLGDEVVITLTRLVADRPQDAALDELMKIAVAPDALVVARGGVKHAALALRAHPRPRLRLGVRIARHRLAHHQHRAVFRVVIVVKIGLVPGGELLHVLHRGMIRLHDFGRELRPLMALEPAADELVEPRLVAKAPARAVHRHEAAAALDVVLQVLPLVRLDPAVVGVEQQGVKLAEIVGVAQRLLDRGDVVEIDRIPAKRAGEHRVVQVGVVMLALVAEEQNADRAVVGLGLA